MNEPSYSGRILGGRYTVHARLGTGGWGSVYAATQNDLGRPVAIKVLHTHLALSTEGLARFEREAKAAASFGHPNIAQVTDFQTNPGEPPFLVMEMLTGQTLGAVLDALPDHKMHPARLVWIAYQVLAALDVAHRAGLVHRDIKPDNVFLVSMPGVEDHVKLLDFGIAKLAGDASASLTAQGTLLGSPAFMAPEQVLSNDLDPRADLYALGATMYLALAGQMPFQAESIHALMFAITQKRVAPLHEIDPSIDAALSDVVARAMHRDRDGRFPSALAMRQALEPWLAGGAAGHAIAGANPEPRMVSPLSMATAAQPAPFAPTMPYVPPPAMTPPPPPPVAAMTPIAPVAQKSNVALVVAIVGVVLAVLLAGGFLALWFALAPRERPVATKNTDPAPLPVASTPSATSTASVAAASATTSAAPPTTPGVVVPSKGKSAPPAPIAITDSGVTPPPSPSPTPASGKQYAGTRWYIGGGSFGNYPIDTSKAAVMRLAGPIGACFTATELDPPDHQFTNWTLTVDASGAVTNAHRTTDFEPHPKFDACIIPILRQVRFDSGKGGGEVQIEFTARTKANP